MRTLARVVLAAVASACLTSLAFAKVRITVDLDAQTMHVESKDRVFDWKVSSGKSGYDTPPGTYGVLWMDKDHLSDEYNQTPMPNAIFFKPGFAIHGAYKSDFGHPASHGCIRLPVAKSAVLFDLVKAEGAEVRITGGEAATTIEANNPKRPDATAGFYDGARSTYGDPSGYRDVPGYGYAPRRASGADSFFGSVY